MPEWFEISFSEGGVGLIETLATGGLAVVAEKTMDAVSGDSNHGWYCTIRDTVTQITVKCWGFTKEEAREKSLEEIRSKIENREDELEREIADIKQREEAELRQRKEQKRETPSKTPTTSSTPSTDENGCLKIVVYIVLVIGAIALAIWLAVNIVLPVTLLNSALIFAILALIFKQQKLLFAILALLGGSYMMLDIMNGWFSLSFVENVVKDSTWISVFVYLNAIALGIATYLLIKPIWGNTKLIEVENKKKNILFKVLSIILILAATAIAPIAYLVFQNPLNNAMISIPVVSGNQPSEASSNTEQLVVDQTSGQNTFSKYTPCTFEISLPSNFKLSPMYADESPDRCDYSVVLEDGFEIMELHSSIKSKFELIEVSELFEAAIKNTKINITYKTRKNNWFIISGLDIESGNIIYWKRVVGEQFISDMSIEYPKSRGNQIESYISEIQKSFLSQ